MTPGDRTYTDYSPYGPNFCDHEGCDHEAEHVVEYEEDASYRYRDRWIPSSARETAYYCDEHLPEAARVLATRHQKEAAEL